MVFTIMVAIICLIIGLPVDALIGYFMDEYCSKRPEFEKIGKSTHKWLGLATQDLHTEGDIEKSDLEEMFEDIERQRGESLMADQSEEAREERKYKDMLHLASRVYDDFLSPSEELDLILKRTREFLISDLDEGTSVQWKPSGQVTTRDNQIAQRSVKLKSIIRTLRINEDGTAQHLSLRQYFQYGTPRNRLVKKLELARNKAEQIARDIAQYESFEHYRKDTVLIQNFILDQLTMFKRYCLAKDFFMFEDTSPESIDPISWIVAWIFVSGALSFFVYWMFAWGVKNGGETLDAWGTNFGLGAMQDILILQMTKLYIIYVIAILAMIPQLKNVHRTLNNAALQLSQEDGPQGDIFF